MPQGERRRFDDAAQFRIDVMLRLDELERMRKEHHQENQERLAELEAVAKEVAPLTKHLAIMVEDWTGGDDPESGMRRMLKKMIVERRTLDFGWKVLIGLGSVGATLLAGYTAVMSYLQKGSHP